MKVIEKIISLYYDINNIYLEMYKLELNGKKHDNSFLQLINLLKEKLVEEDNLFEMIERDEHSKIYNALENENDALCKRICDYINLYDVLNMEIDEDDFEDIEEKELLMKLAKLYSSCTKNIFLIYFSLYQEYLDSDEFIELRDKLLNLKYYNSFVRHDMEKTLIDCNYDVSKINYVDLYFVADTLKLNTELCDEIILDCYLSTINLTIMQLLTINDDDYDLVDKQVISINNQCMLRACLALLSEKEYNKIKKIFIGNIKKLVNNNNNKISFGIINSIILERKKDKSRVKKIYIRYRED